MCRENSNSKMTTQKMENIEDSTKVNERKDASELNEEVNFDTLISAAGELGRYQIQMLISICPYMMFSVFVYYSQIFITEIPEHWCWIPELGNLSVDHRKDLGIPKVDRYSQCYAYDANWTEVLEAELTTNETWKTIPCQNGWEFDTTKIPYPTISSDFEWVCDRKSYQTKAQMIFFVGSFFGSIIIGWIADRFGRIPAVVVSNSFALIGGVSSAFVTNFVQFSICRCIMGMAFDTCLSMPFLIVFEYIAPKYRSMCANVSFAVFYSLFSTMIPFIALACGHWKTICLATSLPIAFAFLSPITFPESPRWLLSKGRIDDAIAKISDIAKRNGKEVPIKLIDQFKDNMTREKKEDASILDIFKRPLLRRTLITVCIAYVCCEIVFDGIVRNLEQLDFDIFTSFAASSATELPSILFCALTLDFFGKRWLSFFVLAIASTFSILTIVVTNGMSSLICAVIARFAVSMSYNIMLQWTAELLPTSVRGSGVALVHIFANFGYIISSYIAYLKTYFVWLPFLIIGVVAGIASIMSLFIPETCRKEMPHTFDEADELIKSWKMWDMPFIRITQKKSQGYFNQGFEM